MYKIIGDDGRQYGPINIEQLRQWIAESRANAQTQTLADGAMEWKPLGALPEFANHFAPVNSPLLTPLKPEALAAGQMPKTNSFAMAGLIFGILSVTFMCCCGGFPFNVLGIIFSLIGLSQIKQQPQRYNGRGLAIAGLILSISGLALGTTLALLDFLLGRSHFMWQFKSF